MVARMALFVFFLLASAIGPSAEGKPLGTILTFIHNSKKYLLANLISAAAKEAWSPPPVHPCLCPPPTVCGVMGSCDLEVHVPVPLWGEGGDRRGRLPRKIRQ